MGTLTGCERCLFRYHLFLWDLSITGSNLISIHNLPSYLRTRNPEGSGKLSENLYGRRTVQHNEYSLSHLHPKGWWKLLMVPWAHEGPQELAWYLSPNPLNSSIFCGLERNQGKSILLHRRLQLSPARMAHRELGQFCSRKGIREKHLGGRMLGGTPPDDRIKGFGIPALSWGNLIWYHDSQS
jgi:hypothetical protein